MTHLVIGRWGKKWSSNLRHLITDLELFTHYFFLDGLWYIQKRSMSGVNFGGID